MSYDSDDESDTYTACAHCGKSVFAGVFECPYCHKDPSGEDFPCQKCGRALPTGAAEYPYCKSYTGEMGEPIPQRKLHPLVIFVIIVIVVLTLITALVHPWG